MSETAGDKGNDFKLERYKYILQQLHSLNENVHKYLSLYQALATAVIGGGILIFVSWRELKIDANTAKVGVNGLLGLLVILTLLVVVSLISSIFSWLDYRREEVELLNEEVGEGFRKLPERRNFWRWHETYIVLFLVVIVVAIYFYVTYKILPLIN